MAVKHPRVSPPLPPEALEQLRGLLANFDRLKAEGDAPQPGQDHDIEDIRKRFQDDPSAIWWSDLAQAELCVVTLLGTEQIRAQLTSWRRRMHEVIGDRRYAVYLASASDASSSSTPDPVLRADLVECIRATYYFYGAYGVAARSRSDVTKQTFAAALCLLTTEAILTLLLTLHRHPGVSLFGITAARLTVFEFMLATSAAAIVGSIVSVQRRLQDPTVDVDPFYREIQTTADRFGVAVVSPLFGAIFGLVIYGLLESKLISSSVITLNPDGGPDGVKDVGVLLIFGFLAGFAEQLVPDALTRIATQTLGGVSGGSAPSTTPTPFPSANLLSKQNAVAQNQTDPTTVQK